MASEFARLLGYDDFGSFRKAVHKAMIACDALGVPLVDKELGIQTFPDGAPRFVETLQSG